MAPTLPQFCGDCRWFLADQPTPGVVQLGRCTHSTPQDLGTVERPRADPRWTPCAYFDKK